jgi:hypothetical protein
MLFYIGILMNDLKDNALNQQQMGFNRTFKDGIINLGFVFNLEYFHSFPWDFKWYFFYLTKGIGTEEDSSAFFSRMFLMIATLVLVSIILY